MTTGTHPAQAYSPYGPLAASLAGQAYLKAETWNPKNADDALQEKYVYLLATRGKEAGRISELESNATASSAEHVAWLEKRGWKAQVQGDGPDRLFAASVLDVQGRWREEGWRTKLLNGTVDAAQINKGVTIYGRRGQSQASVVCIEAASGDRIWLEMADGAPKSQTALVSEAMDRFRTDTLEDVDDSPVIFPMIDFAGKNELTWLVGLWTTAPSDKVWTIADAKQQVILQMSHQGFRARSADEQLIVTESVQMPRTPFVIDKPFIMSLTRKGLTQPLFVAHLTQDAWKDPGEFLK